jgi:hypothetical protein
MAPETEETTPAVVEPTPEAPPVAPEETGAEPLEAPVNELAEFRAARQAERDGSAEETPEEAPAPDVQAAPAPPTEEPVDMEHQIVDPDTGEVLDRRTRAAKRIEALLRERHELRQQIVNQPTPPAPEAPQEPEAPTEETEPTLAQFTDEADPYAAFVAANARWHARQEVTKAAKQYSAADRTAQVETQVRHAQAQWDGKLDEVRKRLPNFDHAYQAMYQTLPTDGKQRPLVEVMLTSPVGHDIAHYLGTHPEAIQDLYNQPTLKAHLRAIGKLEAQAEAAAGTQPATPALTPVDAPPAPMNPVGAAATPTNYDSRTATLAQFRKRHGVRGGRRNL